MDRRLQIEAWHDCGLRPRSRASPFPYSVSLRFCGRRLPLALFTSGVRVVRRRRVVENQLATGASILDVIAQQLTLRNPQDENRSWTIHAR